MERQIRRALFDHYWWCLPLFAAISAALIYHFGNHEKWFEYLCAVIAAIAGVFYFVQKQKLDELKLFSDLFKEFNKRYSDMATDLGRIAKLGKEGSGVDEQDKPLLCKYYDLCAEEYLFWREGRILDEVWKSWCEGMLRYLKIDSIKTHFKSETESGSYYGLTFSVIAWKDTPNP